MVQNRKETAVKYQMFLNEIFEKQPIRKLSLLAATLGMTPVFGTFLLKRGYLKQIDGKKEYTFTDRIDPFTVMETQMLISEFNRWRHVLKTTGKEEENPPVRDLVDNSQLAGYTTKELLTELKRRGYKGTLSVTKEIKF